MPSCTMQLLITEHLFEDLGFLTKFGAKDLHTLAGDAKQCDDEPALAGSCRHSLNARFFGVLGCSSGGPVELLSYSMKARCSGISGVEGALRDL